MLSDHRPWRVHVLAILAYVLLALALTWPLAAHFQTHVPGNGVDDPPLTWNLWWVPQSLLQLQTNPFAVDYLFYPLGINLAFYTLTVLNGLLSIPLQAVFGLIPASNILLLSSFVLSGYGAFLLAAYLLASSRKQQREDQSLPAGSLLFAAFAGGLLYAFASTKLSYAALGQWNIASSQWIPFYVLYLFKMGCNPRRWRYPLIASLFLLLQAYAELTYAAFLVLFTALWTLWQILVHLRLRNSESFGRIALNLVLMGLAFAVGMIPVLGMMIPDMLVEGDIFVEGSGFAEVFSADLLGFLVPTDRHPLLGFLVERLSFHHGVGQHIYLGYAAMTLAVVGAVCRWRRSEVKFWSASAFVFWLLTLGPTLRINGHDTGFPLPFALVAQLPFFKGNRYPSRYSVVLILSVCILVAYGLAGALEWAAKHRAAPSRAVIQGLILVLLVFLLLFGHLSMPLPLSDMRVPQVYRVIAEQPRSESTLLDLPVAWRNGFRVTGTQHPIIMFEQYYQTAHGKRILAGNTSRNPPLKFQYFTEAPLINTVIALETGHPVEPSILERDRSLAADVLRFFDIGAIVIHRAQAGASMVPYVEATMPVDRFYEDEESIGYWVELPPWPLTWTVEPGDDLGQLSYAEGWGLPANDVIWAQRKAVRLLVPMAGESIKMAFRVYAPTEGQRLQVESNGWAQRWIGLRAGWADYEVALPVQLGLNEIRLHFETLYPAAQVQLSPRIVGATGVESPVNLAVRSAGQEVGDYGHIYVNGRDVSLNERGYNVAVLHPQSGDVEQVAAFDTHLDDRASLALAEFLEGVPGGYIVAVAAADEASRLLSPEAVDALRSIGATGDLRDHFRWGHAIIGVKGASAGTALEEMDWMRPVSVVVGEGATEPKLAAAFATITFSVTQKE